MEDTQNYEASQKNRVGTSTKHGKKGIATRFQWIFLVLIISTVVISTTAIVLALLPSKEVLESNAPESQTSLLDLEELEYFKVETQRLIMSLSHQLNNSQAKSEILEMELANQKAAINSLLANVSEFQTWPSVTKTLQESVDQNQNQLTVQSSAIDLLKTRTTTSNNNYSALSAHVASLSTAQSSLENHVDSLHPNITKISCSSSYEYNPYSNSCFKFYWQDNSWQNAQNFCKARGGHLATFGTLESASWLTQLLKTKRGYPSGFLIGGSRSSGVWRWSGRITSLIQYDLWANNEPSGDGSCMGIRNYKFNDLPCGHRDDFLCEF